MGGREDSKCVTEASGGVGIYFKSARRAIDSKEFFLLA